MLDSKSIRIVLPIIGVILAVFLGAKTIQSFKEGAYVGKPVPYEHSIMVEGQSIIKTSPNLATLNLGMQSKAPTVAEAQKNNTEAMNALIEKLKGLGVKEEDVQTSYYNAYENLQWNSNTNQNESKGWIVDQGLEIKVRNLDMVSKVVETAGSSNVTNISGPNFSVEDPNAFRKEARTQALKNAEENAMELSRQLGVKLKRVIGYSEWINQNPPPYPYYGGMGGGMMKDSAIASPTIQPGTEEVVLMVNVSYEIE